MTAPRPPDVELRFTPMDLDSTRVELVRSTDGLRQLLVIHDGEYGLVWKVTEPIDVEDLALKVEAVKWKVNQ